MRSRALLLGVYVSIVVSSAAQAENWPQFRGPGASGLTAESQLPTAWGPEDHVAWKVKIPGTAWSQPIVWGDRIFLTTAVTENQQPPAVGQGGGGGGRPGGGPRPEGRPGARGGNEDQLERADRPDGARSKRPPNEERPDGPPRGRGGGGPGGFGGGAQPPDQEYRWMVMCLDRTTGKPLWEQLAHKGKPTIATHRSNTYASETPLTDGERLYVYFGMTGLYCYDLDGKSLWNKSLGSYPITNGWGTGSSPALDGDRLFVQCDNDQESFLVALDKRSGKELWRVPREEQSNWSTPFVWRNGKRTELVTAGGDKMRGYDPADGKLLWELNGVAGRCSATPVGTDELIYVGVGGGRGGPGPLVAIHAGAEGKFDLDDDSGKIVAWKVDRAGPPLASPLVYHDCIYVLDQRGGIVGCYDAKTGKEHYKKRIEGARGFTASPWAHDGKVYCLDEDGQTFVLAAGPQYQVLATNKLDDQFWSSMAVAGNHLLLRGVNHLYSIAP